MRYPIVAGMVAAFALSLAPAGATAHTIEFTVDPSVQCRATLFVGTNVTALPACDYDAPTSAPPQSATLRFEITQGGWSRDFTFRLLSAYIDPETSHRLRYPAAPSAVALPYFISQRAAAIAPLSNHRNLTWTEAQLVWETLFWADRALTAQPAITNDADDLRLLRKLRSDSCENLLTKPPARSLIAPSVRDRLFPMCDDVPNVAALATDSTWLSLASLENLITSPRNGTPLAYRLGALNETLGYYAELSADPSGRSQFARSGESLEDIRARATQSLTSASVP